MTSAFRTLFSSISDDGIGIRHAMIRNVGATRNNEKPDGGVESAVTFSTLLAVSFATVTIFHADEKVNSFSETVVWVTVMSSVVIGFICMITVTVLLFRNKNLWIMENVVNRDPSIKLKMIFLWIFGLGMTLQTTFFMAGNIVCLREGDLKHRVYQGFNLLSSLIMITFLFYQMGLISYMKYSRFVKSTIINFCLMFILLSNVSVWFSSAVRSIDPPGHPNVTFNSPTSQTINNVCFDNSTIIKVSNKLKQYLTPFRMEFFLHATVFLLTMWSNVDDKDQWHDEFRPLPSNNNRRRYNGEQHSCLSVAAIIVSIWVNLPVIITTTLVVCVFSVHYGNLIVLWEICKLIQNLVLFIFVLIGFYTISEECNFRVGQKKLNSRKYILILSFTGAVAYSTVRLTYSLTEVSSMSKILAVKYVARLLQNYFQIVFVINSDRYERIPNKQYRLLQFILLVMCITNISIWLNGTFIGIKEPLVTDGQERLFGNWKWQVLHHIFYPLVLYFHFQIAMDLYVVYHYFKWD